MLRGMRTTETGYGGQDTDYTIRSIWTDIMQLESCPRKRICRDASRRAIGSDEKFGGDRRGAARSNGGSRETGVCESKRAVQNRVNSAARRTEY